MDDLDVNESIKDLLLKKHKLLNAKQKYYENYETKRYANDIIEIKKKKAYVRMITDFILIVLFISWIWFCYYDLNK
jgi:hypothetical protein